jgi:hypothetical protein
MVAKTEFKQPRYWAGYSYSGDPDVKISSKREAAPDVAAGDVIAAPTCLQLTTRGDNPNFTLISTYRIKISGAVRKSSTAPGKVTYELLAPSSDLEESGAYSINHGPPGKPASVHLASQANFSVSLTIERTKDASAVYIREYVGQDNKRYQPQTVVLITLKGGPNLFPSFDIPEFPAVGAYTEASISHGGGAAPEKVATAGACTVQ